MSDAVERAKALLSFFQQSSCPTCNGDCAGANPPVSYCPMQETTAVLALLATSAHPPEAAGVTGAGDVDAMARELLAAAAQSETGTHYDSCLADIIAADDAACVTVDTALAAIKSALARQQHAPRIGREPTAEMTTAGFDAIRMEEKWPTLINNIWRAMWDAAEPQGADDVWDAALVEAKMGALEVYECPICGDKPLTIPCPECGYTGEKGPRSSGSGRE